jgi:hypothetical protein
VSTQYRVRFIIQRLKSWKMAIGSNGGHKLRENTQHLGAAGVSGIA